VEFIKSSLEWTLNGFIGTAARKIIGPEMTGQLGPRVGNSAASV
jgi:hypothetical protein